MTSGQQAEEQAANYLQANGYKILGRNWKTRYCEVDIVAQKKNTVYFAEVKYRKSQDQGSGLDYITPAKVRQMSFAAAMWVQNYNWRGEYALAALEVSGTDFDITAFVEC